MRSSYCVGGRKQCIWAKQHTLPGAAEGLETVGIPISPAVKNHECMTCVAPGYEQGMPVNSALLLHGLMHELHRLGRNLGACSLMRDHLDELIL